MTGQPGRYPYQADYVDRVDGLPFRQRVTVLEKFGSELHVKSKLPLRVRGVAAPIPAGVSMLVKPSRIEVISGHE